MERILGTSRVEERSDGRKEVKKMAEKGKCIRGWSERRGRRYIKSNQWEEEESQKEEDQIRPFLRF